MRFVQLIFSPTGGVKRAAGLLSAPMADQPDIIDLSLPLNGTPRFSPEDVCLIAVPCFGGRVPEIALERLAQTQGGGARAILLSVYGNRSDEDTLFELKGAAMRAGYVPMAAVRAVAQHSIVPAIAAGRSALRDILLTMERNTAVAAVAGFYINLYNINKHLYLTFADRVVLSAYILYRIAQKMQIRLIHKKGGKYTRLD